MKCPKCGCESEEGATFCNMCYERFGAVARPSTPAAPVVRAAPVNQPVQPGDREEKASEETLKKIKEGWQAALVCGSFTLLAVIVAGMVPSLAQLSSPWALVDVALIFGLAFGIRAKSRVAATTMFLYFLAAKLYAFHSAGRPAGIATAALFCYYFFRAMTATFDYHNEIAA